MAGEARTEVVWRPQGGPQQALLECPVYEVLFGGARGGGKTDGMLGEFAQHAQRYGRDAIGIMFRRERTQLIEAMQRAQQIYTPIGATWHEQKSTITFPNGARLKFAYLDNDRDAEAYQGHGYTRVYIEELTNFPNPAPVMKLMATLRSGAGVPCRFRATANPGGPGHLWVKNRYIDPAPAGFKIIRDAASGLERVFIPSKLVDNRKLIDGDPEYVSRLRMSGNAELVRAWLEGDWSVIAGAFFDEWSSERHVVKPFEIPADWLRFRAGDWGSAKPFAYYWFAVVGDDTPIQGRVLPRGALVVYREWYGCTGPNVGLKMTAEEVADGIKSREQGDKITYGVMDPATFAQDGGPSIASRMAARGVRFRAADNKRVGKLGALGGWDQFRARLRGDPAEGDDPRPMLVFFDTCVHAIRTVPALQHDTDRPEDVDTDGEDHAGDGIRYGLMSRPWVPKPVVLEDKNPRLAKNAFARQKTKARL